MISRRLLCRNLSGAVLNALANVLPELLGGSADLTPSNKTDLKGVVDFQKHSRNGRYIRFGVREHAMAAICNGMASYGAIIPYCGTFLNFIGYAMGAVRLSALSHFRVLYVATHDSIGLGEDGPTHQPVELMEGLRATPNMFVYRPADGNETSAAYAAAILNSHAPAIVAATGSEVTIAIDGAKAIAAGGKRVQVASMPCLEIFDRQTLEYRQSVLGEGIPVLTIEASAVKGWERYGHAWIGMTTFGYSGPYLVSFGATPKFQ
jgi:transketolase